MNRRHTLVALSALLGQAAVAQAQTVAPGAGASQPEMDHVRKTAMVGTASLQESDVALQKATNPKVKEFAKFEHDEQTTVAEIFKTMDPSMAPPALDTKATDAIAKLKAAQAGAGFDRMYVTDQIEGHQMLLATQEEYLKVGKDREHLAVTKLVRGMVLEHLALLNNLKATVG